MIKYHLDRPFIHNGNIYPVLKDGYKPEELPNAVSDFKYLRIFEGDTELKDYLESEAKSRSSKDKDTRAVVESEETNAKIADLKKLVEKQEKENTDLKKIVGELQKKVAAIESAKDKPK